MYFGLDKYPVESRLLNSLRLGVIQRYKKYCLKGAVPQK
jgi:hypothetical protein